MAKPASSLRTTRKRAKALIRSGKLKQAHALYMAACKSHPADAGLWLSLASLDRRLGLYREAEQCAQHVLSIQAENPHALVEYGAALQAQGRPDEAIALYQKAIAYDADCSEAHYLLANACLGHGQSDLAIDHYRKTITIKPAHIEALNNLSAILTNRGEIQASMELLKRALKIQPNGYRMLLNLARLHVHAGEADKAHEILKRVIHKHPDAAEAHSKYLLSTNYLPHPDPELLYEEHKRWGDRRAKKIKCYTSHTNTTATERPLRIGYVSPDLRKHSVAYFIEPILAQHNRKKFIISCYADVENPDDTSQKLASLCNNWNWTAKLSDDQLCEKIRADQIDILVDLAGHTGNNRLMAFARKPAPVAVSYLGYPNTTGLSAIDYRLTDSITDPPGIADKYYTEKLIRLDNGFLCYQPPENAPGCARLPEHGLNGIVFGSFNNLAKLTPEVIHTWSRILKATNKSRLLLKNSAVVDPYAKARLVDQFFEHGIEPDRLILRGHTNGASEHLRMYNRIDIALDTFPYNGTTTSCEALWMGVPVVTLSGNVHASRVGASLLSRLDLEQLVTSTPDDYIQVAIRLAERCDLLTELRRELRSRMQKSVLLDTGLFTKNIEAAYIDMWRIYGDGVTKG